MIKQSDLVKVRKPSKTRLNLHKQRSHSKKQFLYGYNPITQEKRIWPTYAACARDLANNNNPNFNLATLKRRIEHSLLYFDFLISLKPFKSKTDYIPEASVSRQKNKDT